MVEVATPVPDVDPGNRYSVDVRDGATDQGTDPGTGQEGWSVAIVDPVGRKVSVRACRDEIEARTFASTVRQHIAWLSEARFRQIYRLTDGV